MTTSMNKNIISMFLGVALIVAGFVFSLAFNSSPVIGSAPSGLKATMATSSTIQVGPGNNITLFIAKANCSSRVISTVSKALMLSFDDMASSSLSALNGHQQAASTTIAYDSGIYGCGLVNARSFDASTTITISEFN